MQQASAGMPSQDPHRCLALAWHAAGGPARKPLQACRWKLPAGQKLHLEALALDVAGGEPCHGLRGDLAVERDVGDGVEDVDLADLLLGQADLAGERAE